MVARQNEIRDPVDHTYRRDASSDQIKRDIDHTRSEMDETIDALGERLRPRRLLEEVLGICLADDGRTTTSALRGQTRVMARRAAVGAGRTLFRQVKEHPVPALFCAAGLGWMLFMEDDEDEYYVRRSRRYREEPEMYSGSYVDARTGEPYDLETYEEEWHDEEQGPGAMERARGMAGQARSRVSGAGRSMKDRAARTGRSVKDSASETGHSIRESVSEMAESVSDTVSGAASRVRRAAGRAGSRAGEAGRGARHRAGSMGRGARRRGSQVQRQMRRGYDSSRERFEEAVEDYPLAVGLGLLALGALVGLSLPRTRREDEWMGEQSDHLKHRVRERGEEAVERGKHVAEATVSAVTEESKHEGLSPGSLGEKVRHVAEKTWNAAEQAAHEEGLAPSDLKEKTKQVAKHAKDTAKEESRHQSGAVAQHAKSDLESSKPKC